MKSPGRTWKPAVTLYRVKNVASTRHGQSQKPIRHASGRKTARNGQLKGKTAGQRVGNWYDHVHEYVTSSRDTEHQDRDLTCNNKYQCQCRTRGSKRI